MEAMTLIQQLRGRAAFLRDKGRIKSPGLMEQAANALEAHLAQTAQAVDVGAIEPVIRELRKWPKEETLYDHRATRLECADKLTRALSGEKAGPVGDDLSMYECEGCGERPGKPHSAGCWTRIATTSTTPGKEGA